MDVSRCRPLRSVTVTVDSAIHVDGNDVQLAVSDTAFDDQGVGKSAHRLRRSLQDHAFQAVVVIEVGVHARHGKIVVPMLEFGEPLGEVALMMVVDVGEVGHAVRALATFADVGLILLPCLLQVIAKQVADRLGSVAVATRGDQFVEGSR